MIQNVAVFTRTNPGFVSLGQKLGKDRLFNYITKFGFGSKTGIDLNGEGTGILFNLNQVGPVELATTSFGQGVSVTPIQQITAVSAAINGGILYKPYIVKSLNEPETNSIIEEKKSIVVRKVITDETSKIVRDALEKVVAYGTGRNAYIEGYRVGGKTGTAPIARQVLLDSISALGIKRRSDGLNKTYNYLDKKYVVIPNVVGMNVKDAVKELKKFKVEFSGTGNTVSYQSPSPGLSLYEGDTIRLMLTN